MTPAMIALILQAAFEHGPKLGKVVYDLFHTPNPTPAQWGVFWELFEQSYEHYVPQTQLPKPTP